MDKSLSLKKTKKKTMARGYEDFSLPVKNVTISRKWVLLGIMAASAIALAVIVVPLLPKSLDDRIDILYDGAQNYIDNGNLLQAQLTYSQIIELKPNEEKAWHEKGKILVRINSCSEAETHRNMLGYFQNLLVVQKDMS